MPPSFSVIYQDYMYTIINKDILSLLEHHTLRRNILGKTHGLETQHRFPCSPTEGPWGGNGGGLGRDEQFDLIPWANEFWFIASMPCKTRLFLQIPSLQGVSYSLIQSIRKGNCGASLFCNLVGGSLSVFKPCEE
uniref:uncharacterized protein LOC105351002 isoform X1 n=1 Tax=Fragaria vesca subsp. vesca TaxID=101020 RepID=UPI0005C90FEF|nr:PREDICTED: uncharacterized protein LOC105351002 isoform X1 [Fragaria vesca subsp. vesca]